MQTPLVYRGYLYNLQVNGQLICFDALTGEVKYKQSLNDAFSASGVAADGKVYFSSETGIIYVIKAGPTFELLATPGISGNTLFIRTRHFVAAVE